MYASPCPVTQPNDWLPSHLLFVVDPAGGYQVVVKEYVVVVKEYVVVLQPRKRHLRIFVAAVLFAAAAKAFVQLFQLLLWNEKTRALKSRGR